MSTIKYLLPEDRIPTAWYNIQADFAHARPGCTASGHGPAHRPG